MVWVYKLTESNKGATYCQESETYICDGIDVKIRTRFLLSKEAWDHQGGDGAYHAADKPWNSNTPAETYFGEKTFEYDRIYCASWKPKKG